MGENIPRIVIVYKMWLKDKIGRDVEEIDVDANTTIHDLAGILSQKHSFFKSVINKRDRGSEVVFLVNGRSVPRDYVLRNGDKVIVLPLVSGG